MALQDGFPSASGLADANDVRLALAGLMVRDSSGNPRTGIFFRNTTALVTSTATMNSSVAAFEAALSRSGQGVILLANNGATNVLHDTAPVANSRYDTIYVKQNDAVSPNADANSLPVFGILKGAPSVSPTLPTYATAEAALDAAPGIGAGAEPLTAVLIPSTATSMQSAGVVYTQLYQYTATTGGVVPFRTKTALDLWTTAQVGQVALVLADNTRWQFISSAWVPLNGDSGWIAPTLLNSWVNLGGGYNNAGHRLKNGTVILRGLIKNGNVASGTTLFTLPVGSRPLATERIGTGTGTNFIALEIYSNGDVKLGGSGASSASFMLDGIRFETT